MSSTDRNIATIQQVYGEFSRQDVPAIMERLHPDVAWELDAADHGVPWLKPGHGREHALSFFHALGALEFKHFSVHAVMGAGPWVVGLVHVEIVNPANGREVRERMEGHVWRFDDEGRITGMRHLADTHQHWLAAGNG